MVNTGLSNSRCPTFISKVKTPHDDVKPDLLACLKHLKALAPLSVTCARVQYIMFRNILKYIARTLWETRRIILDSANGICTFMYMYMENIIYVNDKFLV